MYSHFNRINTYSHVHTTTQGWWVIWGCTVWKRCGGGGAAVMKVWGENNEHVWDTGASRELAWLCPELRWEFLAGETRSGVVITLKELKPLATVKAYITVECFFSLWTQSWCVQSPKVVSQVFNCEGDIYSEKCFSCPMNCIGRYTSPLETWSDSSLSVPGPEQTGGRVASDSSSDLVNTNENSCFETLEAPKPAASNTAWPREGIGSGPNFWKRSPQERNSTVGMSDTLS